MSNTVRVFAPAKVNLYLHITGRRPDGYHLLDSLIAFADIGDIVEISEADEFSFSVTGPFAQRFSAEDSDGTWESQNIIVCAVRSFSELADREAFIKLTLTKNLPLASGIGGGSADAAAVLRGLQDFWKVDASSYMPSLLLRLGADVPVCGRSVASRVRGVGEILEDVHEFPDLPVVLVNPNVACPTSEVFGFYSFLPKPAYSLPDVLNFSDLDTFVGFLGSTHNDLLEPALQIVPEIGLCLEALGDQSGCVLARLSGSGATCFGVFKKEEGAQKAAQKLSQEHPDWWVKAGVLKRNVLG